jgi:hypothetical protein
MLFPVALTPVRASGGFPERNVTYSVSHEAEHGRGSI